MSRLLDGCVLTLASLGLVQCDTFPEIDVWCLIKQALAILFSCLWFIDTL
jgi:hypothetical protein